jgi:hypothetical protein
MALGVLVSTLLPARAQGQYLSLLPSARPAIDIRKVPVGAWAEYRHVGAGGEDVQRFALVGDTMSPSIS